MNIFRYSLRFVRTKFQYNILILMNAALLFPANGTNLCQYLLSRHKEHEISGYIVDRSRAIEDKIFGLILFNHMMHDQIIILIALETIVNSSPQALFSHCV